MNLIAANDLTETHNTAPTPQKAAIGKVNGDGKAGMAKFGAGRSEANETSMAANSTESNARYGKDISLIFANMLREVARRVAAAGWRVANVDVTILAEAPKIAPRSAEMRGRMADGLGLPVDRVSLKATTMEKLGPIGAREAIAAQAVALLEKD